MVKETLKTTLSYGDWQGVAEADIADFCNNSMDDYLKKHSRQYDAGRYQCKGCRIYVGGGGEASLRFICFDKKEDKFVAFNPISEMGIGQIFGLFKRFEIIITEGTKDIQMDEKDCFDLEMK